jgi:YbbR domain-containing protein
MKLKRLFFNNFGLKLTALLFAIFVWIQITGKERSYIEKTVEVNAEYINVSKNIDVRSVRPEKALVKIKGTSSEVNSISSEDFKLRVDLKGIRGSTKLNFFTEDYLTFPEGANIVSIQPKMIEIIVEELMTKEVQVKVRYVNMFKPGIKLISRSIKPEKVKIVGYKSQIQMINMVYSIESIDLSQITESKTIKLPLKKSEEILKFENTDQVEVSIVVENKHEKR